MWKSAGPGSHISTYAFLTQRVIPRIPIVCVCESATSAFACVCAASDTAGILDADLDRENVLSEAERVGEGLVSRAMDWKEATLFIMTSEEGERDLECGSKRGEDI